MTDDVTPVSGSAENTQETQQAEREESAMRAAARQDQSADRFTQWAETGVLFNPRQLQKKFEKLEEKVRRHEEGQKSAKSEKEQQTKGEQPGINKQVAENYYKKNPELQPKTLLLLQSRINPEDDQETILSKLQDTYADKSLADEALDFLIDTAGNKEELRKKLIDSKERFNAEFGQDIRAGRNIAQQARQFSQAGLGNPTALRDLYREITTIPREPHDLFKELSKKFQFSDMKNIIDFILHSLGADMKAKGPSISKAELQRLFSEARSMQAILGLFRFFFGRMNMIQGQFNRFDLTMPSRINFELLAKLLMELIEERYPSADKILKLAYTLGISEELAAQIIIFSQYRDALRHISPKLFKSEKHRQELLMTLIETLSDLEDELEEEEEDEEFPPPPRKPKDTIE